MITFMENPEVEVTDNKGREGVCGVEFVEGKADG